MMQQAADGAGEGACMQQLQEGDCAGRGGSRVGRSFAPSYQARLIAPIHTYKVPHLQLFPIAGTRHNKMMQQAADGAGEGACMQQLQEGDCAGRGGSRVGRSFAPSYQARLIAPIHTYKVPHLQLFPIAGTRHNKMMQQAADGAGEGACMQQLQEGDCAGRGGSRVGRSFAPSYQARLIAPIHTYKVPHLQLFPIAGTRHNKMMQQAADGAGEGACMQQLQEGDCAGRGGSRVGRSFAPSYQARLIAPI
ncbi:hypothetical protein GOBAR_AA16291 [Gossypium barbadense]|uniref:Uncharacterized protein n=1 Tax=Gossypium barbadense TaxID=3634 RepID=A0A2P5XM16_GOSBA|nr:hypothetical protein GOBAR_AA16291 [Gossypium barbadense]